MIVRIGSIVIEMTKLLIEIAVLIITHFDHIVFHTKCVAEVYTNIVVLDLNDPVVHVFAVEEWFPFISLCFIAAAATVDEE